MRKRKLNFLPTCDWLTMICELRWKMAPGARWLEVCASRRGDCSHRREKADGHGLPPGISASLRRRLLGQLLSWAACTVAPTFALASDSLARQVVIVYNEREPD